MKSSKAKGGKARMALLTPKERKEFASKGGEARWSNHKKSPKPPRVKVRKFPYNLSPRDFINRARSAPFGESWTRIGDTFFGVQFRILDINASSSEYTVKYFMTSGQIPPSTIEPVDQDFWERTLINVCKSVGEET